MANPKRYLQTGTAPSPQTGGATQLATLTAPVEVAGVTAPVAGQVLQASSPTNALWATPAAAGIVDDPTVRVATFTAAVNTRYFIDSTVAYFDIFFPPAPAQGDVVAFVGIGIGTGFRGFNPNPHSIRQSWNGNLYAVGWGFRVAGLDVAFRFTGTIWEGFLASLSQTLLKGYGASRNIFVGDSSNRPNVLQLPTSDGIPGRVENSEIQELRPYNVGHNLYSDSFTTSNTDTGSQAAWMSSVAGYRAPFIVWEGSADLIVRGMDTSSASDNFRQDKLILNNTAEPGANTFKNIVWSMDDTGAINVYRVRHSGSVPSTGFSEYIQAPGEAVVLRYGWGNRWWLSALPPSGRVDRKLATTSVTPAIIHTFTTRTNSRVIAYKVQVQARKTVGTTVGDSALFDITVLCERSSAGTVVVKDVVFINGPYKDAGAAAWDVTFTISGSDIRMNVVGDAVDTIQ